MQVSKAWIQFGMLTASAAVAALVVNAGIARLVAGPEAAPASPEGGAAPQLPVEEGKAAKLAARLDKPRTEDEYLRQILDRNIFDQSKIGLKPKEGGGGDGGGGSPSDINMQLTGTIVAEPAAFSAAFILRDGDKVSYAYGIGQSVGNLTIMEILKDRVRVSRNGAEEWLVMGGGKQKVVDASEPAPTGEAMEGVEQLSETEFRVSKALLDQNLNDLEGLSKLGRALLHRGPDGEYDGYRLSAIRRGSLADKLGIRNGDIIHNVNGTALNSVPGAMEAFSGLTGNLQGGSKFQFEVTRRGQPVTLSYEVQ